MKITICIGFVLVIYAISFADVIRVPSQISTIQGAIDISQEEDTVLVAPGVYDESINFSGKNIIVMSESGMDSTIIQGDGAQRVVTFESREGVDAMLIGFTIENGNGGILCINQSDPTIWKCKIRNNSDNQGGGLYGGGGGIRCVRSSPLILNSVIYANQTSGFGGGIYGQNAAFNLINSVVDSNRASSPDMSGIMIFSTGVLPSIMNSIVWNNKIYPSNYQSPFEIFYCDVEESWTGPGNISQDPRFVDPGMGNYRLQSLSPCINTGNPLPFFNDADGSPNDMGAYGGSGFACEGLLINMGEVPVQSYDQYSYHLYNLRDRELHVTQIQFSNSTTFRTTRSTPVTLPPFSIFEIPILFEPDSRGSDSTILSIGLADSSYSDVLQVWVKGEGVNLYGNESNIMSGVIDAGLTRTIFLNEGEIGLWPNPPSGEWPNGSGHHYLYGSAFIVQAEVQDTAGNIIHPMETQYRELVDTGPNGELWGWLPLPGFAGQTSNSPALSTDPLSWPYSWPNRPSGWDNYWNGFHGRGITIADEETYFVMDDSQDREWGFYPVTSDTFRRGLGLEVEVRGYTWTDTPAEDVMVWQFEIHNESDYDYQKVVMGIYLDPAIGGGDDSFDDIGTYLPNLDMVYFSDADGYGTPGNWHPVGMLAVKYLEMPGNAVDGIDNDSDGLIDESRDNGIDDDGDWDPFSDDVGMDGVSGTGDPGENDGMPTNGEPNFDKTDKQEADDIHINTVRLFPVHTYELWNEEENWQVFTSGIRDSVTGPQNVASFIMSKQFPLHSGETSYFSYAMIFGEDLNDLLINAGNIPTGIFADQILPRELNTFQLFRNYPNPFNPKTTIEYALPHIATVKLEIFNIVGQRVAILVDEQKAAGHHDVKFDGRHLASGVYFYRIQTAKFTATKKMLLMK